MLRQVREKQLEYRKSELLEYSGFLLFLELFIRMVAQILLFHLINGYIELMIEPTFAVTLL